MDGAILRAATALHTTPIALFLPLLPVQLVVLVYVFAVATCLGYRESKRIARIDHPIEIVKPTAEASPEEPVPSRPRLIANKLLVHLVLGTAVSGKV